MATDLWPNGNDKNLITAVGNYLEDLLSKNKSKLSVLEIESLTAALESLQTVIAPDDDKIPQAPFSLQQLYQSYKPSIKSQNDNQKPTKPKPATTSPSSSTPSSSPNITNHQKKFLEFIKVLQKHDFFKGCDAASPEYKTRMEKARLQYNTRFPAVTINSLDWLYNINQNNNNNNNNDVSQPMDTDPTIDDKKQAELLKQEGNKLLGQKKFNDAVHKYTLAIQKNNQNAVYYSNRAAAYTYLKQYKKAVADARKASEIDPSYVKAYVREGLAEFEMGNYQKAHDAYSAALNKTKSNDKNWETYMDKVQMCQNKIDEVNNSNKPSGGGGGGPDLSNLFSGAGAGGAGGGGGGGQPDLSGLLGGLGGMDGLQNLMKNPMMQKMAQQMMKDPDAMKKMGAMMGQMQGNKNDNNTDASSAGTGTGAGSNQNDNNNDANDDVNVNQVMQDLLQNPEKAQKIFKNAMGDPEVKELLQKDPSIEPLIDRIKTGDYAAFIELGSKPEAFSKIKVLIKKYYKK